MYPAIRQISAEFWTGTVAHRRYGYPPDKQEKATLTVLEQAEVLCKDWAGIAA